ncbi:unnamed protein product [Spirodela intermedia]|uniref:Uncharacterized protein n=2 Tax=Spirodela intermedia TaxID=51605 RepID=A0A7I8JVJ0_SPIIN|nr:unnamed protein product [Spirodela intermedia]CAA6653462.1 unnamed protein product [Spirodela intermedia]CAA7387686.1 unnamed protein product [Spirodela intermedia]
MIDHLPRRLERENHHRSQIFAPFSTNHLQ